MGCKKKPSLQEEAGDRILHPFIVNENNKVDDISERVVSKFIKKK